MRDEIRTAADLNGRSMNAEIVHRLKSTLEDPPAGRIYIDLPTDVDHELAYDAVARRVSMSERAAQIVAETYRNAPASPNTDVADEDDVVRSADLREQVDHLTQRLERDFVLYYGKVGHISQFIAHLLDTAGEALPETIRKSALELQSLSEAELNILRQRYEEGLFWVQRRDNEAANARDIAAADLLPKESDASLKQASKRKKPTVGENEA